MLRMLSSKIFRENLKGETPSMWAFENFEDVEKIPSMHNKSVKFCLPVSLGDFPEIHIPACFSTNLEDHRLFVEEQKRLHNRRAFIISDFRIPSLDDIIYSGTISTFSEKHYGNAVAKSTTLSIILRSSIKEYQLTGTAPRDLEVDLQLTYNHLSDLSHSFPKVEIKKEHVELEKIKFIILRLFLLANKIHEASEIYDGEEYASHTIFYIDKTLKIILGEITGEDSFIKKAKIQPNILREELNIIKKMNIEQPKTLQKTPIK